MDNTAPSVQPINVVPITIDHGIIVNADVLADFELNLQRTPKTAETYRRALHHLTDYMVEHGRAVVVGDSISILATHADMLQWRSDLIAAGYTPATVNTYIAAARSFFKWVHGQGLGDNIAEGLINQPVDKDHKRDYLTSSQVKAVLANIDRTTVQGLRDYAMFALAVCDGLRTIEISRADVGDLRTAGDDVVLYVQGKGRQDKTDFVRVSAPVDQAIRAYLKARGTTDREAPLFASTSNRNQAARMSTRSISAVLKSCMQGAGYDSDRLTAHSLRHTAVTLSLLAGRPIEEVRQFARHANIETTLIYAHHLDKAKNSCSDAVANALF